MNRFFSKLARFKVKLMKNRLKNHQKAEIFSKMEIFEGQNSTISIETNI